MRCRWLLVFALASACAADEGELDTDDIEAPDEDGKLDAASELRVRVEDTTLWVNYAVARRGDLFVLRGRTSRNITDGNAFVFDDVYGDFAQRTVRTYEVTWPVSTARTLVDGVNLFSSLTFVPSSSRPTNMTTRVVVRPRLATIAAPSALAFTAELTPVVDGGHTVYRVKGRSTKTLTAVTTPSGEARLVDPTHFEIDLDFEQLINLTDPTTELTVAVTTASGPLTIRGRLGLVVKRLGLTTRDIETQYPVPTCTAEMTACLTALPDPTLDLASCGEAIKVRACAGQVGLFVDAAALTAARTTAETKLTTLATDATGLLGADRAPSLVSTVREVVSGRLAAEEGAWLLSAAARQLVLARAADVPFDDAYAYPLAFVDGLEPAPNDLALGRHVAADELLGYLRTQDFTSTEYGRSYLELTKMFRAQHVQSLREFRDEAEHVTFASQPEVEYYVGRWLGSHTEVTVERATGTPTHVLVEID